MVKPSSKRKRKSWRDNDSTSSTSPLPSPKRRRIKERRREKEETRMRREKGKRRRREKEEERKMRREKGKRRRREKEEETRMRREKGKRRRREKEEETSESWDFENEIDEESIKGSGRTSAKEWQKTIARVLPAMVVLNVSVQRAFDTYDSGTFSVTGFVVDKKHGIILTNRHIVMPGPVTAEAIFVDNTKVPVYPIYRDPVHDFGFFRYDPEKLCHLKYTEITLNPSGAYVGLDVKVIGNSAGEKVSIHSATISRMDRDAPRYNEKGYNDFNTFYIQATSSTTGGSSGSPVIDVKGQAVALNAGGGVGRSSMSLFLPLDRILRALKILQHGREWRRKWGSILIPRGTLQVIFRHTGFQELHELSTATKKVKQCLSSDNETGMLVVDSVTLFGPSDGILFPGDILVSINGTVLSKYINSERNNAQILRIVSRFSELEELLDENVKKPVKLAIERDGKILRVELKVDDLHSITPDRFLEVGGGVIHALSYQQANNFHFQCGLVYVAYPGYMLSRAGVPRHAIIVSFNGEDMSSIDDLNSGFAKLASGAQVGLDYVTATCRNSVIRVVVTIDRHQWYAPPCVYKRDDNTSLWLREQSLIENLVVPPMYSFMPTLKRNFLIAPVSSRTCLVNAIVPMLVFLKVTVPSSCMTDGVFEQDSCGTGVIIHQSSNMGLIVTDKTIVSLLGADVTILFSSDTFENPGQVVFVHPEHNFSIIAYNPITLGIVAKEIKVAELLSDDLRRGENVNVVGVDNVGRLKFKQCVVTNPYATPPQIDYIVPGYRAVNMEVIEIDTDYGNTFSGVLTNKDSQVLAIWANFSAKDPIRRGIPVYPIKFILDKIVAKIPGRNHVVNGVLTTMPILSVLETIIFPLPISLACNTRLNEKWYKELIRKDPDRRQVLVVKSILVGSSAANDLRPNDMILALNGKAVTCYRDLEKACDELDQNNKVGGKLKMTVLSGVKEREIDVMTNMRDGNGTTRIIHWCGYIVHHPHPSARALAHVPDEVRKGYGVYVAGCFRGSPSNHSNPRDSSCFIEVGMWIVRVRVNGIATTCLDDFIEATKKIEDGKFMVDTVDQYGFDRTITVNQNLHYWPTVELLFSEETSTWQRNVIEGSPKGF